jgi:hypothetical protein
MGVFTAQPSSTLLAGTLLAAGFALLGTVLLLLVCVYRRSVGASVRCVAVAIEHDRMAAARARASERPLIHDPFPRVQSEVRRPTLAGRAAAPSRAPPILPRLRIDAPAEPGAPEAVGSVHAASRSVAHRCRGQHS